MFFNEKGMDIVEQENGLDYFKSLILKRDKLKKDEMNAYIDYVKTFGELLEKRFSLQIECIKNKKIISICQAKKNRGEEVIFLSPIEEEIDKELGEYYEELQTIHEISREKGQVISEYELLLIKKKYKRIAMRIHPDLHSEYANDSELMELWERVKSAYKCNDLQALEEAELLVAEYLKKHGEEIVVEIENIEEKINKIQNEIDTIVSNDPYRYKFILDDTLAIERKKEELESDIEEYQAYLDELLEKLNEFNIQKELLN
jgi:hypothetical protein